MMFRGQTRTYAGLEGYRRNWLDRLEQWATYRTTMGELIDAGESVVALLRDHGRRKDMDAEVELIGATTFRFRGGKRFEPLRLDPTRERPCARYRSSRRRERPVHTWSR